MITNPPKLSVLIDRVRSAYNVGSIFRSADSAGIDKLYITGYSAIPPHPKLQKTALGATDTVSWEHHCDALNLAHQLKKDRVKLVALEPLPYATDIFQASLASDTCLIFGHEEDGIRDDLLKLADQVVQIPHFGHKESLNVAVAAGIAIYEYKRKLLYDLR